MSDKKSHEQVVFLKHDGSFSTSWSLRTMTQNNILMSWASAEGFKEGGGVVGVVLSVIGPPIGGQIEIIQ